MCHSVDVLLHSLGHRRGELREIEGKGGTGMRLKFESEFDIHLPGSGAGGGEKL